MKVETLAVLKPPPETETDAIGDDAIVMFAFRLVVVADGKSGNSVAPSGAT
jgi:hypothetical protein